MINAYLIASYLISLGYVFLGVIIYDWTTHMAPALDGRSQARVVFWELFLICLGLILYATSFLHQRGRLRALSFSGLFYAGLIIILIGGIIVSAADQSVNNGLLRSYSQFLSVALVLYAPMLILFLLRRNSP